MKVLCFKSFFFYFVLRILINFNKIFIRKKRKYTKRDLEEIKVKVMEGNKIKAIN